MSTDQPMAWVDELDEENKNCNCYGFAYRCVRCIKISDSLPRLITALRLAVETLTKITKVVSCYCEPDYHKEGCSFGIAEATLEKLKDG